MTEWHKYLTDKDQSFTKKKKRSKFECKRNKISGNRYGSCEFNENDECRFCHRPRRKTLRLDTTTNTVIIEYFE